MSDEVVKSWTPGAKTTVAYAVRKLLKENQGEVAVALLVAEVANGRFSGIVTTFATLSPVKESAVRQLLSARIADDWTARYMFEVSGLPPRLYSFFSTSVDLAQEVVLVHRAKFTPQAREVIIEKTLAAPAVQELHLSEGTILHLRSFAGMLDQPAPPST